MVPDETSFSTISQLLSSWSPNYTSLFRKWSVEGVFLCWPPLPAAAAVLVEFAQLELLEVKMELELFEVVAVMARFVQVYLDVPFVWVSLSLKCAIRMNQMLFQLFYLVLVFVVDAEDVLPRGALRGLLVDRWMQLVLYVALVFQWDHQKMVYLAPFKGGFQLLGNNPMVHIFYIVLYMAMEVMDLIRAF